MALLPKRRRQASKWAGPVESGFTGPHFLFGDTAMKRISLPGVLLGLAMGLGIGFLTRHRCVWTLVGLLMAVVFLAMRCWRKPLAMGLGRASVRYENFEGVCA